MVSTFTAIFEQDGSWWIGYVEELPGAYSQGITLEEARQGLRESIELILSANREQTRHDIGDRAVIRETITVQA
jgi:predicted RNase H-like HicB family nuclease